MSNYVKVQKIELEFDGDRLVLRATPIGWLEDSELEALNPGKLAAGATVEEAQQHQERAEKLYVRSIEVFKPHVQELTGLTDAAGAAVSIEEFFRDSYFKVPVAQAFRKWYLDGKPKNPKVPASGSFDDSSSNP